MTSGPEQPDAVGVLAAWGRLPIVVAQAMRDRGHKVICLGVRDHAVRADYEGIADSFHWIGPSQLGSWSLDARLWAGGNGRDGGSPGGPYLERNQLVGKAICVYWPHSWYSLPGTGRRVPAVPNVSDMRLVR